MLNEIPAGWHPTKLGDITELKTGGTPSRKEDSFWGGDINWMSSGEVWKKRVFDTEEKITEAALSGSAAKILPKGSVMIALNGQGRTRGAAAILERDMTCNQSLAAVVPSAKHNNYFMLYFIESQYQNLRNITGDNARNGLNLGLLKSYEVLLPPLTEQHRIAEILSSVDASIQATQAVIEQAERVKRGLMEELLTGGLGNEAIERGEVPEGWAASTFGDEIDFKGGNQPPKSTFVYEPAEGYVRLLQIRDFENDDKPAYIPVNATKVRCSEDDILIARYGASLGRICRGKEGAYNVALVKLILSENLTSDYAFYWLNSNHFQNFLARVGSRSAQAGFNKSDLAPLSLVVPPLEEQKHSSEILASLDGCITKQKTIIEQLARTKRGLMDDLLTGKVRTV